MDLDKFAIEIRNRLTEIEGKIATLGSINNKPDTAAQNRIQLIHDRLSTVEGQINGLPRGSPTEPAPPQTDPPA